MKKRLMALMVMLLCFDVQAEQEVVLKSNINSVDYVSGMSGPPGCKWPTDVTSPKSGECEVRLSTLETGWKIVKVGDTCYQETTRLIQTHKIRNGDMVIDAPETERRRYEVVCPA